MSTPSQICAPGIGRRTPSCAPTAIKHRGEALVEEIVEIVDAGC